MNTKCVQDVKQTRYFVSPGFTILTDVSRIEQLTCDWLEAFIKIYQMLIDKLEQPFELSDLYKVAEQNNFPHPILTVSRLRGAGMLISEGEGLFIWNR